ncbi:hypothetical protein SO802_000060 [Lithocarpus litseifolius]|uniref:CCHC-type domain-containing protein n=1 Tax=Lithocarpus litseifolius TaxID=425828 RepID=A0AAW2DVM5_9ROSI
MGSELRIIEVGNNTFQFKFKSHYQMEWVENSGPWNFDNNLLLLCRWKKGLTSENIVFTHSPFWVQLWGLPFELMSEVVGRDIGNSLGRFIEIDKRANQSEQAKFMRIKVDLPIDLPLRSGGNIVGVEGDKFWVHFKYERLPTFCFRCGKMGHDEKRCQAHTDKHISTPQYGDWLRAYGASKSVSSRPRSFSNGSHSIGDDNQSGGKGKTSGNEFQPSPASNGGETTSYGSDQNSRNPKVSSKSDQVWGVDVLGPSACLTAESRLGLDNLEAATGILNQKRDPHDGGTVPTPMEVSGTQVLASNVLPKMGQNMHVSKDPPEATSPHKPTKSTQVNEVKGEHTKSAQANEVKGEQQIAQDNMKAQVGRGRIKKLAREQGLAKVERLVREVGDHSIHCKPHPDLLVHILPN